MCLERNRHWLKPAKIDEEIYGFITVKPEARAEYKVEIIVEAFYEGYTAARYGLLYLHE